MAGIIAKKRKLRPTTVVISLVSGLVVAVITYFIYRPLVEQLKSYADDLPNALTEVLPVEEWWVLPLSAALFWFVIAFFVTYGLVELINHLRHKIPR